MADIGVDKEKAKAVAKGMEQSIGDKMSDLRRRMAESIFGNGDKKADKGLLSDG